MAVLKKSIFLIAMGGVLASCGGNRGQNKTGTEAILNNSNTVQEERRSTIWDLFNPQNSEQQVKVNKYLWAASLEVLDFLPIQSVDPFTGVIVTGYGTPPGGGRAYRATVLIKDPALDARSLSVALATRGGPVADGTQRAVEDAILARARQLRINDRRF